MNNKTYYQKQINKALDFINDNLSEEIRINQVAKAARFSEFHFQRIYKALQNETPYETILRLRLEKAVFLLKHFSKKKIIDVAIECGFESTENFSRQFKLRYKHTPSQFKKDKTLQNSRIYQEKVDFDFYNDRESKQAGDLREFEVSIETLPKIDVALMKAIFGKDGSILIKCYEDLISWANENGINTKGELTRFGMSIDDPQVTPANKYRYDFAIKIDREIKPIGIIELSEIPGGKYATIHCIGKLKDVGEAWNFLYKKWLPESDYFPRHFPAIEEYIKGPEEIGWDDFNIKCRVPIERINYD